MPPDKKSRLRRIASGCVFWSGCILIGVIAIPTGILIKLICLIWKGTNFAIKRLEKD